jgi:hypothetical protein
LQPPARTPRRRREFSSFDRLRGWSPAVPQAWCPDGRRDDPFVIETPRRIVGGLLSFGSSAADGAVAVDLTHRSRPRQQEPHALDNLWQES